jgi:hypothetical protein
MTDQRSSRTNKKHLLSKVEIEMIESLSAAAVKEADNAASLSEKARQASTQANNLRERAQGAIQLAARRLGVDVSGGDWEYRDGTLLKRK